MLAAVKGMTFSNKILVGLSTGIVVGLFLGEYASALTWAADGFVKLLQMTVLPYVTVSIVGSLGKLKATEARLLGLRAGLVLGGLWLVALVFAGLIVLTFPRVDSATFFSTTLVEPPAPFDLINLYIPANPFNSLANNVVPAVVLFSVVLGIALIGIERKQVVIDLLDVCAQALSRASRFVVQLTPYGLFAIAATSAGTLNLEQVGRLQVYLVSYVLVALLVALWVLPGLVAALTPIRVRDIMLLTRDALITAFVAGDLFIVLPVLIEASKTLIDRHHLAEGQGGALPEVIVPASFNFPHSGKLLSISFILFAGWFADAAVPISDYPRLALAGLVTFFGSLNVAVPFLLDLFRIPVDTFQLFLASGVINSRFGTLVAAVHTVTVALLATCAVTGSLKWDRHRLLRYGIVTAMLTIAVIGGTRVLFGRILRQEYTKDKVLAGMHVRRNFGPSVVHRTPPPALKEPTDGGQLERMRRRGALRVGYTTDALPFAFFNARDELVGFDIEMAYNLAAELGLRVDFVPVDRATLDAQLNGDYCDIVMSGVVVTTTRASRLLFSSVYLDETLGLLVRDGERDRFSSWDQIRALGDVTFMIPDLPYYSDKIRERAPLVKLHAIRDATPLLTSQRREFDAIVMPAERGSAWTLIYPQFTVVVPEPGIVKVPLAYPIAGRDEPLADFINAWIELKRKDGTIDSLYKYWILGQNATPRQPRWSIMRNVLGWVD
jgi:Na+/H+-dicarboxylate symporter/ABC-type amino acid transport substrate-binding protein